jgi:hypothetical protein
MENLNEELGTILNNKVSPLYSEVVSYLQIHTKLYWELERQLDSDVRGLLYSGLNRQIHIQLRNQMKDGKAQ